MFNATPGPGFFTGHQIMMGFMSGFFLGMVANAMLMLVMPDTWHPKYHPAFLVLIFCIFLIFVAHFTINGHVRLIGDNTRLKKTYGHIPSEIRIKFVKISFWPLYALGSVLGFSARNELFFLPK